MRRLAACLFLLSAIVISAAAPARAEDYPTRTIKVLTTSSAGQHYGRRLHELPKAPSDSTAWFRLTKCCPLRPRPISECFCGTMPNGLKRAFRLKSLSSKRWGFP